MASSASRWSRAAVNRSWAKRSLRILVEPAPVTFAERRSVLQVLQQKGPIEVFTVVPVRDELPVFYRYQLADVLLSRITLRSSSP